MTVGVENYGLTLYGNEFQNWLILELLSAEELFFYCSSMVKQLLARQGIFNNNSSSRGYRIGGLGGASRA
jgi:hypothetical protein